MTPNVLFVRSESGDMYMVPVEKSMEIMLYRKAVAQGNESEMLKYETGETGWIFCNES